MKDEVYVTNIFNAAYEYYLRKTYGKFPKGRVDKGGRWFPSIEEKQSCCLLIRAPSRSYPHGLREHCKTLKHVANLFNVDSKELKKYYKTFEFIFMRKDYMNLIDIQGSTFTMTDIRSVIVEQIL